MEQWWNDTDRETDLLVTEMSHCQFVYRQSYVGLHWHPKRPSAVLSLTSRLT